MGNQMSLNWNLGKIEDYKTLCWVKRKRGKKTEEVLNPVTKSLIFAMLAIGMRGITAKNWEEVFRRLRIFEMVIGSFMTRNVFKDKRNPKLFPEVSYITPDEVKAHIGLHTNVSPNKRELWFRVRKDLEEQAEMALRNWRQEQKETKVENA